MKAVTGTESINVDGDMSSLHAEYVSVCEIEIDAPAGVIWPHVVDIGSWIYDLHFEHISGDRNGEGELRYLWPVDAEGLKGVPPEERSLSNALVLKTLTLHPEKLWYAVNLPKFENGILSTGVNVVILNERKNGKTLVTAIRSKESLCPTAPIQRTTQDEMLSYQPIAQRRWVEKYMPRLKQLSEKEKEWWSSEG